MRAAVHYEYGDTDLVQIVELPIPFPGPEECLVRVQAASINPADWKYLEGRWRPFTGNSFPRQLGADFSGTVVSSGTRVVDFSPGDPVLGSVNPFKTGTLAEYVVVSAKNICKKPDSLDFAEAAAIPIAAVTAYIGLNTRGSNLDGENVLVTGSGGGVGHIGVQLAKHFGARVTAVCSKEKGDFCLGIGADVVIDYTSENIKLKREKFDVILDCASTYSFREARAQLRRGGELLVLEIHGNLLLFVASFLSQRLQKRKMRTYVAGPNGIRTADVAKLFADESVKMTVSRRFPLESVSAALGLLKAGHALGKLIIEP